MARRGGRTVGRLIADALAAGLPALLHLEVDPRRVTPDRFG